MDSESRFLGVSWRGILAFFVILTVCGMSYIGKKVEEPLYSLVLVVSSAYFGSKIVGNGKEKKNDPNQPQPEGAP